MNTLTLGNLCEFFRNNPIDTENFKSTEWDEIILKLYKYFFDFDYVYSILPQFCRYDKNCCNRSPPVRLPVKCLSRTAIQEQDLPDFYESLEANLKITIPLPNGAGQTPHAAVYPLNREL